MTDLTDLLQQATVRLINKKTNALIGTAFFITEDLLLTACHNLPDPQNYLAIEHPFLNIMLDPWHLIRKSEKADYAIIKVKTPADYEACLLGFGYKTGDELYSYGYSLENTFGDSVTIKVEGNARNKKELTSIKAKDGKIEKGMSGSPVLNMRSGRVIGMVVETRDVNLAAGGYLVSIQTILSDAVKFEDKINRDLFALNQRWHLQNTEWLSSNKVNQVGIGFYDETWQNGHFDIFPIHKTPLSHVFIEPLASLIKFNNGPFSEESISRPIIEECNRIINNQPVLIITGAYGAGKSLVSRMYQLFLLEQGYDTIFISANKLLSEKRASSGLYQLIYERASLSDKLFVFIDAFDELNSLYNHDMGRELELLQGLINSCQKVGATLIINYRTLESEEDYSQYEWAVLYIRETHKQNELELIRLNYFNSHKVREWVENYAFIMEDVSQKQLSIGDIYKVHKHFIVACHNPLLLYIINRDFYEEAIELHTIKNIYDLYSRFVNDTIQGKFSDESMVILPMLQMLGKNGYKKMLQEIAFEISKKSKKFTVVDSSEFEDLVLDKNEEIYGINEKEIPKIIADIVKNLVPDAQLNMDKLDQKLLNCYFFSQYKDTWRFKDNNILFFFLAEKVFGHIIVAVDLHRNGKSLDSVFNELKSVVEVALHPVIIELLLNKLTVIEDEQRAAFVFVLRSLITKEYFLSIPSDINLFKIDFNKINLDIFLCILFVQLNREGYYEITFFFKRFTWLLSVAKRINPNMVFLAKRFYKSAQISNAEFRRVNLKGYNFDETRLRDVTFIQGKIYGVRKNNSTLQGVKYLLCEMSKVEMNGWSGDIEFENCLIKSLVIKNPTDVSHITFDKCSIIDLQIMNNNKTISLTFKNCYVQRVILTSCDVRNLSLKQNVIINFKIRHSFVICKMDKNIEIGSGLDADYLSEVRYEND